MRDISANEIFLSYYVKRREMLERQTKERLDACRNRLRILQAVVSGSIVVHGKRRSQLVEEMGADDANILSKLSLDDMTDDGFEALKKEETRLEDRICALQSLTPEKMWTDELNVLEEFIRRSEYGMELDASNKDKKRPRTDEDA